MAKNTDKPGKEIDADRAAQDDAKAQAPAPAKPSAPAKQQDDRSPHEASPVDATEQLAREICKTQGRDAETLISYGAPTVIGTPEGNAYLTDPKALVPMWRCYEAVARATIKINKAVV